MLYFIMKEQIKKRNTDHPYLTQRSLYADKLEVYQEAAGKRVPL